MYIWYAWVSHSSLPLWRTTAAAYESMQLRMALLHNVRFYKTHVVMLGFVGLQRHEYLTVSNLHVVPLGKLGYL